MQMSLIHESITDAIREAVQAIGGNKALGALMFPDLPVDQAAGRVRDCLNPDRREHFTSSIMEYLALDLGYLKPVAVEPEDEIARLQREFVQATKSLHNMASRIETITATAAMRRVA